MPMNDLERSSAVHRFLNLKINREKELENIIKLKAEFCRTPRALITFSG
jgi:hypothetical protein